MEKNNYTKAFGWCEDNKIRIYPKPRGAGYVLYLEEGHFINKKGKLQRGKVKTSGKIYTKKELNKAWEDFYIYIWKKYSNGST